MFSKNINIYEFILIFHSCG